MIKVSNLFKNKEYEALFFFAYPPEKLIQIDKFNFDEFENEVIKGICKDVVTDFKVGNQCQRFMRHPRITFKECFKSKEHMIVFFLIFYFAFSVWGHGCGDFKENILKITESTEAPEEDLEDLVYVD